MRPASGAVAPPVRWQAVRVFLDFEASSLGKNGFPIEVAWVFEDGGEETHLIRPAPGWTEWDPAAEAIHHIPLATLRADGQSHDQVAQRMVEVLTGHDLLASAPSWDGKWLSLLLRAAGLPRHALRLRDTEEAWAETARDLLRSVVAPGKLEDEVESLLTLAEVRDKGQPAHRALPDAQGERARWLAIEATAADAARERSSA